MFQVWRIAAHAHGRDWSDALLCSLCPAHYRVYAALKIVVLFNHPKLYLHRCAGRWYGRVAWSGSQRGASLYFVY